MSRTLPDGEEDLGIGDDTDDLPTTAELRAEHRAWIWAELDPAERATAPSRGIHGVHVAGGRL